MVCLGGERVVDVGALFKRKSVTRARGVVWALAVVWLSRVMAYDASSGSSAHIRRHKTKVGKEERRMKYEQATHPYEYEVGTPGSAVLGGEFGGSGLLPLLLSPPVAEVEVVVVAEEACASLGAGSGWWRLG